MKEKTSDIDILEEKEKKAIEIIKFLQDKCIQENGTGMMPIYRIDDLANAIKILLNLIEKQFKEIEELKKYEKYYEELKEENEGLKTKLDTLIEKYKEMLKHRIEYTNKLEKDLFQNASNYVIPKSKVKDEISYLMQKYDLEEDYINYETVIEILQELLGKE